LKPIDLRWMKRATTPAYRSFIDGLTVGSTVGVKTWLGDCQVWANGIVTAVDAESVWAEFPRLEKSTIAIDEPPAASVDLPAGKPVVMGMVMRGQAVDVIETYRNGLSCMVSGEVTAVRADGFDVQGQRVDYGPKDHHGRNRKLTARCY
jgi:hypothetical protein